MFDRLISLVGEENFNKITNTKVLVIGLGGVGGHAFESLVRSGIRNITVADYDRIDITNLNRQIITNSLNIGNNKTEEALKHAKEINPNISIKAINEYINKENLKLINLNEYDYIIDACDSIDTKILLITETYKKNVKLISSMGMANKLDPSKISITKLDKTSYDALAKKLRKEIPLTIQKKTVVVSSTEKAFKTDILSSNSFVPAVAGLYITSYIINDIIKE